MAFALIGGSYGWIQGVAWVGMTIKGIHQYQSITQALDKTFDGSAPCSLCDAISQNQSESEEQDNLLSLQKQKEIAVSLQHIFILSNRLELATLSEISKKPLRMSCLPEIPPPKSV